MLYGQFRNGAISSSILPASTRPADCVTLVDVLGQNDQLEVEHAGVFYDDSSIPPIQVTLQPSCVVEQRQSKVLQLSDVSESGAIEQTADVVMFMYRDDVYNPETERRNQADIIVAKHRNGPVGEVTLHFGRGQTQFRDLNASQVGAHALPTGTIVESVEDDEDDE